MGELDPVWLQLGVSGLVAHFALAVVKEVLMFVKPRNLSQEADKVKEYLIQAGYEATRRAVKDEVGRAIDKLVDQQQQHSDQIHALRGAGEVKHVHVMSEIAKVAAATDRLIAGASHHSTPGP